MVLGTIKAPCRPRQSRASLGQTEAIATVSQESNPIFLLCLALCFKNGGGRCVCGGGGGGGG